MMLPAYGRPLNLLQTINFIVWSVKQPSWAHAAVTHTCPRGISLGNSKPVFFNPKSTERPLSTRNQVTENIRKCPRILDSGLVF